MTGHRDIAPADVEHLRKTVEGLLVQLRRRLPGIHVELVSGMADGADRIAAEAALAAGMNVHALLPMPLDMYLTDFDETSQAHLRALLADSRVQTTELELPAGDRPGAGLGARLGPRRALRRARRAPARGNQHPAGLWDGEDRGLPGGTGDTVLRYLGLVTKEGARPARRLALREAEASAADGERPVFWLRTRRSEAEGTNVTAGFLGVADDGDVVVTGPQLPKRLDEELDKLVDYARDAESHVNADQHPWGLVTDEALALRPAAAQALRAIDYEYRRADLLAVHHQQRSDRLFKAFSLMAALMGMLFLVYAKIYPGKLFLAGYLVLFAGGFLLFSMATREGLVHAPPDVPGRGREPADALLPVGGRCHAARHRAAPDAPARRAAHRRLQLDRPHPARLHAVRAGRGRGCAGDVRLGPQDLDRGPAQVLPPQGARTASRPPAARADQGGHPGPDGDRRRVADGLQGLPQRGPPGSAAAEDLPAVFLLGLVPFWLGVWEIYQAKMAIKELGWQYQNQLFHLERAASALRHPGSHKRAIHILDDTAERLLADTYLWTVQRFHREHEPPAAG